MPFSHNINDQRERKSRKEIKGKEIKGKERKENKINKLESCLEKQDVLQDCGINGTESRRRLEGIKRVWSASGIRKSSHIG